MTLQHKEFEMLTNILIGLLCYSVFLTLFLVGWRRLCLRNEAYDRASEHAARVARIEAAVKKFPQ
jgi:hypothetical protein